MHKERPSEGMGTRMSVKRIVADVEAQDLEKADSFYRDILGLAVLMDLGWIRTYGADAEMRVQISFAVEGGSGTPVPDLSIEVEDLNQVLARLRAAEVPIEYGPIVETWGVFRCYVRDPFGQLVNILEHQTPSRKTPQCSLTRPSTTRHRRRPIARYGIFWLRRSTGSCVRRRTRHGTRIQSGSWTKTLSSATRSSSTACAFSSGVGSPFRRKA